MDKDIQELKEITFRIDERLKNIYILYEENKTRLTYIYDCVKKCEDRIVLLEKGDLSNTVEANTVKINRLNEDLIELEFIVKLLEKEGSKKYANFQIFLNNFIQLIILILATYISFRMTGK